MCGIAGFVNVTADKTADRLSFEVQAMTRSLSHRGPDDQGIWLDQRRGLALGQRRLSIVDLSPAGHQPMVSADGRFVIVYNGEVYDYQSLRDELQSSGVAFRGTSDTEVILEACAAWSIERALPRLNGMFAFALWDRVRSELTLVRDRLGIKPLYWAKFGNLFLFGSELKALRANLEWTPRLRPDAIAAFMRHTYIPAPHTIYEGVNKLEAGSVLTFAAHGDSQPSVHRYWDLKEVARRGYAARNRPPAAELVSDLDALLRDAVSRRMIADVPLGTFLSGGVDSSVVAAMMQAQSTAPIKTFTIGFHQAGFDEAPHARAVAEHLGTNHTELYVSPQDALNVVPELSEMYDEPFADSSQIPTFLLSRLTRQHVTVALSGDGGDELFAGYTRYLWNRRLQGWFNRVPRSVRSMAQGAMSALSPEMQSRCMEHLPNRARSILTQSRIRKLAEVLQSSDPQALYRQIVSLWANPGEVVIGDTESKGRLWEEDLASGMDPQVETPQLLDTLTYLPDDILTKVDRASMAVGLEVRVPIIDYRVVEFSWRVPMAMKMREGRGKWILRHVLDRYVPRRLIDRPKMGFGVPIGAWLRGPLREWGENLLSESSLAQQGILRVPLVRKIWTDHLTGRQDHAERLWAILMLQAWMRRWA